MTEHLDSLEASGGGLDDEGFDFVMEVPDEDKVCGVPLVPHVSSTMVRRM